MNGLKQWWINETNVETVEMDEEKEESKWKSYFAYFIYKPKNIKLKNFLGICFLGPEW